MNLLGPAPLRRGNGNVRFSINNYLEEHFALDLPIKFSAIQCDVRMKNLHRKPKMDGVI